MWVLFFSVKFDFSTLFLTPTATRYHLLAKYVFVKYANTFLLLICSVSCALYSLPCRSNKSQHIPPPCQCNVTYIPRPCWAENKHRGGRAACCLGECVCVSLREHAVIYQWVDSWKLRGVSTVWKPSASAVCLLQLKPEFTGKLEKGVAKRK